MDDTPRIPEDLPKDGKVPDGYVETYHPRKGKMMVRTAAAPQPSPAKKKKN